MANSSVTGLREVQNGFNKAFKKISGATMKSLMDVGFDLKKEAVQLAPIDTGELRRSGYVDPTGNLKVEVGFNQEYAEIQHESLEFNHPQGGQAKYLEQPFKQNFNKYIESIKKGVEGST